MCEQRQHNLGVSQIGSLDRGSGHSIFEEGNTARRIDSGKASGTGTAVDAGEKTIGSKLRSVADTFLGRKPEPVAPVEVLVKPVRPSDITPVRKPAEIAPPSEVITSNTASAVDEVVSPEKPINTGDPARDAYFQSVRDSLRAQGKIPPKRRG